MRNRFSVPQSPVWRQNVLLGAVLFGFLLLATRVVFLQTQEKDYLQAQGEKRFLRAVRVEPERGVIQDRNGEVLSVSSPVDTLVAQPSDFCASDNDWKNLFDYISLVEKELRARCERFGQSGFMYIERQMRPSQAQKAIQLGINGMSLQREYKRFYPHGSVGAHLVGFTDLDNVGQEGLERVYNESLKGEAGLKHVLRDLTGHQVEEVESILQVKNGEPLQISIDQRLQTLASGYLQSAVNKHRAASGTAVVLSVPSGEILAMVTVPQFNPNDRSTIRGGVFRNRAVTDVLEPGSTIKPFSIAMALESGQIGPNTIVSTAPGRMRIPGGTISDVKNYGDLSVFDVLVKSSNVGTVKIVQQFTVDRLFNVLKRVGFGEIAGNLPGEINGIFQKRTRPIEHATMSYGYGFAATALQLARSYTVFATDGELLQVTLEKKPQGYRAPAERVFSERTAQLIREMMKKVATPDGTARRAAVPRYHVGGKTGTTHKLVNGNYVNERYVSLFAGLAPISDPKFVMVVAVDDPRGEDYYGGAVAAPVFSKLMQDALRLYNVRPDKFAENNEIANRPNQTKEAG